MMDARVVLAFPDLAGYPEGGGHWSAIIQYVLGLIDLGCEVYGLEVMASREDKARDQRTIQTSINRWKQCGLENRYALLVHDPAVSRPSLESSQVHGMTVRQLRDVIGSADFLWNLCAALRQPLLSLFRRRVLVDLDPGILQISALSWDLGLDDHDVFLTVGLKLGDSDCDVPTLDRPWHTFAPFVHLPDWRVCADPGPEAPFSSVTQWTWEEQWLGDRVLKSSKRDAYLRFLDLPRRADRPFELAVNMHPLDDTGDRDMLREHGWNLIHPHEVAATPQAYRAYIQHSRAEVSCAKPIYRELKTGWLSDRSVAYLASGRPVLAEDTGFSDHLPVGEGLIAFRSMDEAVAGVAEIDSNYARHSRSARELAEEYFDSQHCLEGMIEACGVRRHEKG